MYASYVGYFNIIVPTTTFLLGILLIACWIYVREQKELLWIAGGYILPASILATQSGLDNETLARWSIFTAPAYVGGAWCISHGIALRFNAYSHPKLALILMISCSALLYYYSRHEPNLWLRIIILNSSILVTQLLAIPSVLRSSNVKSTWDRLLLITFLLFSTLVLCRIVVVIVSDPMTNTDLLTQSPYWRLLLTSSLFFSLWFIVILLGATLSAILRNLRHERDHDPLTGLLNRRAFFENAKGKLGQKQNDRAVILALDVDHFKSVNDLYGHDVGDLVLQEVAKVLHLHLNGQHAAARFGGEEFIALICGRSIEQTQALAEDILAALNDLTFEHGPQHVTASFGIAEVKSTASLHEALTRADHAVYQAKKNGRNQIAIA